MATGKYLSLEEARKKGKLKEFAEQHPSKGNRTLFNKVLNSMAKNLPVDEKTSEKD